MRSCTVLGYYLFGPNYVKAAQPELQIKLHRWIELVTLIQNICMLPCANQSYDK